MATSKSKKRIFLLLLVVVGGLWLYFKSGVIKNTAWLRGKTFILNDIAQKAGDIGYVLNLSGSKVTVEGRPDLVGTLATNGINWNNGSVWSFA